MQNCEPGDREVWHLSDQHTSPKDSIRGADTETEPLGGDGDDVSSASPVTSDGIPDGFMGEEVVPEYDGSSSELSNVNPADHSDVP